MLVFNLPALAVLVLSVGAFALGHYTAEAYELVIGFGAMTLVGAALEVKDAWRPRFFWVIPAWTAGVAGVGAALLDIGQTVPGAIAIAAGSAIVVALVARAIVMKPGGKWLAGLVGATCIVAGFQVIGAVRPEWKHPVLYVVNAIAFIAAIACGVQLYRARNAKVD